MAKSRRPKPGPDPAVAAPVAPMAAVPADQCRRGLWATALVLIALAVAAGLWLARSPASAASGPTRVPVPGQPHLDHCLPSLLREGLYHADGQQLDEVFVVGSYRQSKMYRMGVACTNCHDPYSAKPKLQGNALCLQCHQPQAKPACPSAAGSFDSSQHHHHAAGTPGAQCTACHMPATCRPRTT